MSIAVNCLKLWLVKIRESLSCIVGTNDLEADAIEEGETNQRKRLPSISRESFELASHYHSNSVLSKTPFAMSRRSTANPLNP